MARSMVRAHPNSVGPSGNLNVRSGMLACSGSYLGATYGSRELAGPDLKIFQVKAAAAARLHRAACAIESTAGAVIHVTGARLIVP